MFARAWWCLLLFVPIGLGSSLVSRDPDLVLHILYGRDLLDCGWSCPDPTVYTTDAAPMLHEWGMEVAFALLDRAFGLSGPLFIVAIVWAALPTLLLRRNERHGFWPALVSTLVALLALGSSLTVRPHVASWVGFLAAVVIFERGGRWLWLQVGLLGVVWVNLHGGGALMLPIVAAASLVGRRRWDIATALASVLSLLVQPSGVYLWVHLADFLGRGDINPAEDMSPPDLQTGTAFTFAIVMVFALVALRKPRLVPLESHLLLVATALLAMTAMRNLPFFGMAAAIVVPPALGTWVDERPALAESSGRLARELGRDTLRWAPAAAIVAGLLWLAVVPPRVDQPPAPMAAVRWLQARPEVAAERGYAGYESGYLLYDTPVERVFLHSLNAVTPLDLMETHQTLSTASDGWEEILLRYGVRWVMAEPEGPLGRALGASPRWRLADAASSIWLRTGEGEAQGQ